MALDAMTRAVDAYRAPSRHRNPAAQGIAPGMLTVIKAAAGDEPTLTDQARIYRMPEQDIREAARHFLLRHLLSPGISGLHMLGLADNAATQEIKDHKRWLLKWLHPDRNPSAWEQNLFRRISDIKIAEGEDAMVDTGLRLPKPSPAASGSGRKHVKRRPAIEATRRQFSFRQVLVSLLRPVAAGVLLIAALTWWVSMRDNATLNPLTLLTDLASS